MNIQTLRIELSVQSGVIDFVASEVLDLVPPPPDLMGDVEGLTGCWYELQDAAGTVMYRSLAPSPVALDVEVRDQDPTAPLRHMPWSEPNGILMLDMPVMDEAARLVLVNVPEDPESGEPSGVIFQMSFGAEPPVA